MEPAKGQFAKTSGNMVLTVFLKTVGSKGKEIPYSVAEKADCLI